MRPPNAPAKWSSIPPSPAIRKSSPTRPTAGQIVILTNPQIGNYGTNAYDNESAAPLHRRPGGPRVLAHRQQLALGRRPPTVPRPSTASRWSPNSTRAPWCATCAPAASCAACFRSHGRRPARNWSRRRAPIPTMAGLDLATPRLHRRTATSGTKPVEPCSPSEPTSAAPPSRASTWWPTISASSATSCAAWCRSGCRVTVVPALTSAEDVLALKPDGVFLSNGPGDPEPLDTQVAQHPQADRQEAHLRHLPGPPDCSASRSAARPTS